MLKPGRALLILLLFIIAVGGLWISLNPALIWSLRTRLFSETCDYPRGCAAGRVCMQETPGHARCFPSEETVHIPFPLPLNVPTICTQGPLTAANRTHSYLNTAYAVDLSTHPFYPDAEPRAVFEGRVVVNTGCANWDQAEFSNDTCGQGFGNWVALFAEDDDLVAFYAHLRTVAVETGQTVEPGQVLGQEGKSGAAGHRHVHFSLHRNLYGLKPADMEKNGAWLPPSIPFTTRITNQFGNFEEVHVTQLPCEDNNDLSRAPFFGAPEL